MGRLLEDGDELALPWDDLADGRVWQLVRGRDFFCNPREVDEAARNAAARLNKAVQTVRSLHASVSSVWLQFADHRIEPGAPCPCGSDELRRVNDVYAICASCEASLLVETKQKGSAGAASIVGDAGDLADGSDTRARLRIFVAEGGRIGDERKRLAALRRVPRDGEPVVPAERKEAHARERREREERKARVGEIRNTMRRYRQDARKRREQLRRESAQTPPTGRRRRLRGGTPPPGHPEARETLDRFTNVRLWTRKGRGGLYWGCGYDRKGRFVLLEVRLKLTPEGDPVEDPEQPGRALHSVSAMRAAPFSPAVDPDELLARPGGMSAEDVLGLTSR